MLNRNYRIAMVGLVLIASNGLVEAQSPTQSKRPAEKQTPTLAKRPEAKSAEPEKINAESKASTGDAASKPIGTGTKAITKSTQPTQEVASPLRKVERKEMTETPSTLGGEEYLFRYKLEPGLVIASEVTHLAKTDTKIDAVEQNSHSRTVSQKTWEVTRVENGEMTFEYKILEIDMSQRIGADTEIRFNSKSGEEPERQFKAAADSVGKVISTVTIDEQGMIVARSDDTNPPNLGMGDITLPVPKQPIAIGATWEVPRELRIRRDDGTVKTVRFRELFRFDKVSAGVATVAVRSEMLTAISEPKEEAQVLQQLSNGTIKFDIDAGRMLSKELGWDKVVVGFSGAGSVMDYSARLEEQITKAELKAGPSNAAAKTKATANR